MSLGFGEAGGSKGGGAAVSSSCPALSPEWEEDDDKSPWAWVGRAAPGHGTT